MNRKTHILAAALIGGAAAWLWKQARRTASPTPHRELTRWEDEGGNVLAAPPLDEQPAAASAARPAADPVNGAVAGASTGSTPEAWKFPRS